MLAWSRKREHFRLDVQHILCQLPCDDPLLLPTSLQLADMEHREGRRPPPNLGTLNIPLDPCQDSQAAARPFQLRLPHPPASILAWLTPDGPPKPLLPLLAHTLDKKEGLHRAPTPGLFSYNSPIPLSRKSPIYNIIMNRS